MGPTVTIPASSYGPKAVPYPTAFGRTKKFLKVLLRSISDAGDEFISAMGSLVALHKLVHQLEMYARREGPFSSAPNSDTLSWWRTLSDSTDAHVLAVCYLHQF